MSTIVYQGLHSYFESQLVEATTLKLRLASCMVGTKEKYHIQETKDKYHCQETKEKYHSQETNYNPPNHEYSGWSFIQNLSNVPYTPKETTPKQSSSYIHPLTKTSPRLTQKSLALCTETLGSETGCDTMDNSILSLNSPNNSPNVKSPSNDHQKLPKQIISRRSRKRHSFPPPLTTIRGPNSIQIRPHRDNGRLIIEAFETPSRNTCLQAERSNGRLILSFVNDSANNLELINDEDNENDVIEVYEREKNHEGDFHEEQSDDYEENERNMKADLEISTENIHMPGRCNENQHGNRSSCFWKKPFYVATS